MQVAHLVRVGGGVMCFRWSTFGKYGFAFTVIGIFFGDQGICLDLV